MGYQVVLIAALHELGLRVIHFKWYLSTNHSPDGNVGSVQESENAIPVLSLSMFEVLIRRVQSPVPSGDSLLRVQLGPTLIWNVLPTVGFITRGSTLLRSTCSSQEQALQVYKYIISDRQILTHACSIIVLAHCQESILAVPLKHLVQCEIQS